MKPKHIAIIMDGNRRWAKSNNFLFLKHPKRIRNSIIQSKVVKLKINHLTVFGFSENWTSPKKEISYLMKLFGEFLDKQFQRKNVKKLM